MKVSELIEFLRGFDPNEEVIVDAGGVFADIESATSVFLKTDQDGTPVLITYV